VPVRRYKRAQPGETINVDIKQLVRFDRVGLRTTVDRWFGGFSVAAYEKTHGDDDDAIRLAYAEVLPDNKQASRVGPLIKAAACFRIQRVTCRRILSAKGSAYYPKQWRQAFEALGLNAKRYRPYTCLKPMARPNRSSKSF